MPRPKKAVSDSSNTSSSTNSSAPSCVLCQKRASTTLRTVNLTTLTSLADYRLNVITPLSVCLSCAKRIGAAMEKEILSMAEEYGTTGTVKRHELI